MTFEDLYKRLAKSALVGDLDEVKRSVASGDKNNLDCLLNPKAHSVVINSDDTLCDCEEHKCVSSCLFGAIEIVGGVVTISQDKCVGCNACVESCEEKKLTASRDLVEVITKIKTKTSPVYALIAPAIVGQFGDDITIGHIRAALKQIGFDGVVEVATFADILTLKEAIEFAHLADKHSKYQLTSCCCPVWISLIKKNFDKLSSHLTPAVSPMIAAGRSVKRIHPDAITIFISPCLAKKSEARESDLVGAIDNVITFAELRDLFELVDMNFDDCAPENKEHSSFAGRIYATCGGVSEAVTRTYNRLKDKDNDRHIIAKQGSGITECKAMLADIIAGNIEANFYEGMGCNGGCVGGIKTIRDKADTTKLVREYAESSDFDVPIDNPYVVKLLTDLGYHTIDDLLSDTELLCRKL